VRDEDRRRVLTVADLLDRIPPPVCAPGSCWSYADGNYVLAQLVVETATRQPLDQVLRAVLLDPLGLHHTVLADTDVVGAALSPQYALVSDASGHALEPHRLFEQALPRTATLLTTAADAARFAHELFTGHVLTTSSLTEMLDTSAMRDLPCPERCPFAYGLGVFSFNIAGHDLRGHDGGSGTVVVHDRDHDLTVAILTNGGDQDMGAFLDTVLHAIDNR
jgi:D-alanyl-D-alanine carboxypeptidase